MKLLRLKITDPAGFRSLPSGFEHHFRTEWSLEEELANPEGFAPFVCAGFILCSTGGRIDIARSCVNKEECDVET